MMKNCLLSTLSAFAFVAACSDYPHPVAQSPSQESSLQPVQHRRVCDRPITWQYKDPAQDVPDKYKSLMGLWTGEVDFAGGGSMCIAVAVSEVKASGDVNAIFAWNLGASSSAGDLLNTHSQGTANWWAKGVKVGPKGEEMVVFSAKDPYNGLMYEYRFSFPKKDKMIGALISNKLDGTTNSRDMAVLTRNTYPAPLVAAAGK
jgi:hypothetical protein